LAGLTVDSINNGKFSEKEMSQMRAIITNEVTEKVTELAQLRMVGDFQEFMKKRASKETRKSENLKKSTAQQSKTGQINAST
jgi:glutamyl-tRNA reductase